MKAYVIEKNDLSILLDHCLKKFTVYGPTKPGLDSTFDQINFIADLHLEYKSTVLPPKKFFHPPRQTLFTFTIQKEKYVVQEGRIDKKFILFGVHPCDVHAILKLDKFFSGEFKDKYYQNRRKNSIIVALNCVKPGENSFCKSMEAGPFLD